MSEEEFLMLLRAAVDEFNASDSEEHPAGNSLAGKIIDLCDEKEGK
jgi:hypothetical protein